MFEELIAEYVRLVLKLVLHLDEGFKIVFLKQLPLLKLISEIMVEILQKNIELGLKVALQPGEIFTLFNPNVSMKCKLVLLLQVVRCFFNTL